jgi:Uma2 family endonuclease
MWSEPMDGIRITAEEFLRFVPTETKEEYCWELRSGYPVAKLLLGERQGTVCNNIAAILGRYVRMIHRGYVCQGTGLIVERDPDTVLGPHISFFTESRTWDELGLGYPARMPSLTVEVIGAADSISGMLIRVCLLLASGIQQIWVADPESCNITVFRPKAIPEVLEKDQEITGYDLMPDFRCSVAEFFFMPEA